MKYPIIKVRFYQSVEICGVQETYAVSPEYKSTRTGRNDSTIRESDKGIILENDKDLVLVSWNNIASVHYDKTKELANKDAKIDDTTSDSKLKAKKSVDFRTI